MRRPWWLGLCLLGLAALAQASPVWVLEQPGRRAPLYLAGSIHLLRAADYPLPAPLQQAFADSDLLVLEMDLSPSTQQDFLGRMLAAGTYRDGSTVRDHLRADTWQQLTDFAAARQLPLEPWLGLKPWLLGLSLMQVEMAAAGLRVEQGVDLHFYRQALQTGKSVQALESAEQQLQALLAMDTLAPDALMARFFADIEALPAAMDGLLEAWRQGDYRHIDTLLSAAVRQQQPALYQSLLVTRNRAWLPDLEALIGSGQAALVLVGAAHIDGPDGLLALLAARGHTFRRYEGAAP